MLLVIVPVLVLAPVPLLVLVLVLVLVHTSTGISTSTGASTSTSSGKMEARFKSCFLFQVVRTLFPAVIRLILNEIQRGVQNKSVRFQTSA
jgi:preprotein translocase subunit SecG